MSSLAAVVRGSRRKSDIKPLRRFLLGLAGFRIVIGLLAIPMAAFLYREHFLVLVLMRPTKEVLLFGGFLARQHKIHLLQILIAAVPLAILGVWHAYALGRMYSKEIHDAKLPGIAGRILPAERIKAMTKALKKHGAKVIVIGRVAVFPSSILGMAAGSSKMKAKTFLPADALGGLLSIAEAAGAGYLLGAAYKNGKPWLTAIGLAALVGFG
ncbi:MAG TPA: VTT domain-containing protein, partial [Actinomycetota bacterium]|nr:VTT domain-containing protein [Actinomycetota bacterium]